MRGRAILLVWAAPVLFFALAAVVGFRKPGLQYDEALLEHGTVQMLTSGTEPPFAHDQGSWVEVGGRSWPLMVIPYIGAAPQYLLLPVFAAVGPNAAAARVLGASIGALGLLGIGLALARWTSPGVAAAVALVLAIHPGLLLTVLYDNGAFAVWVACLGLLALSLSRYARRLDGASAFCVGLAGGAGVWCRGNFLWLLVAIAVSIALVYGKAAIPSPRALAGLVGGGALGTLPLLVYEVRSRFATLRFVGERGTFSPLAVFGYRKGLLLQSLLCDSYRESIWGAPGVPGRESMFVAGILAGACVLVLLPRRGPPSPEGRVGRAAALALFGYLALAFTSRLGVAAHHLVPVVPLAAIVVVLALQRLASWRGAKLVAVGVAAVYAAMCGSVFADAARGIRATGGVGPWSDAVEKVAEVLEDRYSRRAVYLLGWGLENNLFVLSGGSIASAELSVSDVGAPGDAGARAPEIAVDPDAVYVVRRWERDETTSSRLARFLDRIDRAESPFRRTRVFQRDGAPYADIYAVPGRDPAPARITATFPSTIVAGYGFNVQPSGESALALQGSGFHPSDCVWWNARPLATTFGNPGLISARVPARLFGDPGSVRITIRRGNRIEPGAEARIPIVARR